jgi:hypothetical protein
MRTNRDFAGALDQVAEGLGWSGHGGGVNRRLDMRRQRPFQIVAGQAVVGQLGGGAVGSE